MDSAPYTPYTSEIMSDQVDNTTPDVIYFKGKDPIKLFRAPLDHLAKPGFTVIVPPELENRFFDPINGNHCVQQLKVCIWLHFLFLRFSSMCILCVQYRCAPFLIPMPDHI